MSSRRLLVKARVALYSAFSNLMNCNSGRSLICQCGFLNVHVISSPRQLPERLCKRISDLKKRKAAKIPVAGNNLANPVLQAQGGDMRIMN